MASTRRRSPLFSAVLRPFQKFFRLEAASGVLMLVASVAALVWANSPGRHLYRELFELPFLLELAGFRASFSLHQAVNDGLMTFFFFVVGMEIKRELVLGELRTPSRAFLPAAAALGGMAAPAIIYSAFNWGSPTMSGWAIPTATDIAFSIGLLSLVKRRVGWGLIVFLTALAIFDDMGGIAIIAVFYGTGIDVPWLIASAAVAALAFGMGRRNVTSHPAWAVVGTLLWYCVHHSGIHATISGVVLGMMVPSRSPVNGATVLDELHRYVGQLVRRRESEEITNQELLAIEERLENLEPMLNRLVHALQPWVAFGVVPLFAMANAGISFERLTAADFFGPVTLGIAVGLFVGKQCGIFAVAWTMVRLGLAPRPGGGTAVQLWGVSMVGGIGFTVALFVANLSFPDSPETLDQAKLGILLGSFVSAIGGYLVLRLSSRRVQLPAVEPAPAK